MSGRKTRSGNRSIEIPTEVQTEHPRPSAIPVPPKTDEDRRLRADSAPAEGVLGDNQTTKPGSRRAAVVMMASPAPALSPSPPAPIAVLAYGADSCGQYIDAPQSKDDLYLSWVLGFISGANIADTGAGRMAGERWTSHPWPCGWGISAPSIGWCPLLGQSRACGSKMTNFHALRAHWHLSAPDGKGDFVYNLNATDDCAGHQLGSAALHPVSGSGAARAKTGR
jgi:hypothetical protein